MAATTPLPLVGERTLGAIGRLMGAANVVIAGFAAVLSYNALRRLAIANGVTPALAWGFPAILDGVVAVASLATLYGTLRRQRTTYPWLLVLLFTALSTAGNVAEGHSTPVGVLVSSLPPLSFALTWHLWLHYRRDEIIRAAEEAETARLAEEREAEKQRRAEERAAARVSTRPVPQAAQQVLVPSPAPAPGLHVVPEVDSEPGSPAAVRQFSAETLDEARPFFVADPGITRGDLAERIGKSPKTAGRILAALRAEREGTALTG